MLRALWLALVLVALLLVGGTGEELLVKEQITRQTSLHGVPQEGESRREYAERVADAAVTALLEMRGDGFDEAEGTTGYSQRTAMIPADEECQTKKADVDKCVYGV